MNKPYDNITTVGHNILPTGKIIEEGTGISKIKTAFVDNKYIQFKEFSI